MYAIGLLQFFKAFCSIKMITIKNTSIIIYRENLVHYFSSLYLLGSSVLSCSKTEIQNPETIRKEEEENMFLKKGDLTFYRHEPSPLNS